MTKKRTKEKEVIGREVKEEVFPGNKNYERIVVRKNIDVGHLKETYYDIRIFQVGDSDNDDEDLHPTKKGVTIPERILRRICVFLIKDLLSVAGTLE